jgi:hypothetical protein
MYNLRILRTDYVGIYLLAATVRVMQELCITKYTDLAYWEIKHVSKIAVTEGYQNTDHFKKLMTVLPFLLSVIV